MNAILETIFSRRSIRIFDRRKLTREMITDLLKAAMAAPSASNNKPWEFVVITDESKMAKLQSNVKYGKYNAPAAIVVCANYSIARNDAAFKFWIQDCSAATENILIAAAGMGLGAVWTGSYPKRRCHENS